MIAGKRRCTPILIFSALVVMIGFLIYVGVQRSQAPAQPQPVDAPMHGQQ